MKKKKIKKLKKDIKIEAGTAALIQLNDSKFCQEKFISQSSKK